MASGSVAGAGSGAGMGWDGYLVGFALSTWGQDGENLGSDEAEIILIAWAVYNTRTNAVGPFFSPSNHA